ncbi:hypothetical protein [Streptomyces sp. NPDC050388]|uniref:hypothetical protein n=1 Tax=Streptomyces sp. NPDC050388 TaxID=3155781 RepID=UPI0034333943
MTPYERLMAEEIPTGTFGHARPPRPQERHARPWTPKEQAQHLAELNAALDGWQDTSERAQQKRVRHLHLIHGRDQTPHAA